MYKIPSYNQWENQTKSLPFEYRSQGNELGELIKKINSPITFTQRLDMLIELQELCQKSDIASQDSIKSLYQQSRGILSIMLNAKNDNQLNEFIQNRIAMREMDYYYIPNQDPPGKKVVANSKKEYKKKRMANLLMDFAKKKIKLEEADEQILSDMRKEQKNGKEHFDNYLKDLGSSIEGRKAQEHYFKEVEREEYRAIPSNGLLYKQNLSGDGDDCSFTYVPFDTKIWEKYEVIYVLGTRGDMFIYPSRHDSPSGQPIYHTAGFSGNAVISGGNIKTNERGMILHIDNMSGHYRPTVKNLMDALKVLKDKGVIYKGTDVQALDQDSEEINRLVDISMHDFKIAYYDTESAKNVVRQSLANIDSSSKKDKYLNNHIVDILENVDKSEAADEICKYLYAKYITTNNPALKKSLEENISQLLNIKKIDYKNDDEFKKLVESKMKLFFNYEISENTINTISKLGKFIDQKERNLSGFKYFILSKEKGRLEIKYARDAIFNLAKNSEANTSAPFAPNMSEKEWNKSQLSDIMANMPIQHLNPSHKKTSKSMTNKILRALKFGGAKKTKSSDIASERVTIEPSEPLDKNMQTTPSAQTVESQSHCDDNNHPSRYTLNK